MKVLSLEEALEVREATKEAVAACARVLEGEDSDPWDVADAFEKQREWLRRDLAQTQQLLSEPWLQAAIARALKRHGRGNLEVARHGLGVLSGCCQKNDQNADLMVHLGIVQEVLHLMDAYRDDTTLQDNACVALWRLAERRGAGAEKIEEADGLQRLYRAMEDHGHNPFVQVNALLALERLYQKGLAPAELLQQAAAKATERHPGNLQTKRAASRILEVLQRDAAVRQPRQLADASSRKTTSEKAQPLGEWLLELDSVGFLMGYHAGLKRQFNTSAEVAKAYVRGGKLDDCFFRDLGVRKLGHRRLFEKWCRELADIER